MSLTRQVSSNARPHVHLRRAAVLFTSTLFVLSVAAAPSSTAQTPSAGPDAKLGERIYREGILPDGKPVRASVQGDVELEGTQLNCAGCHRRSGFGSSEGAAFVPPVNGAALYREKEPRGPELFRRLFQEARPRRFRTRALDPRTRPAYTDETLAAALREGKDSSGRELDPLMPRYSLSDADTRHLVAYVKSLSSAPAPGVTDSALHFATVITEGVESEKRRALLDVMRAYFVWKNTDTRRLLRSPTSASSYQDDLYGTYREWVLHVWELKGPAETWPAQLAARYREQPVFAVLGGVGEGDWRPVHDFCERLELPCLFPNTDLPVVSGPGEYTLYFSRGLTVEGEALARYLREKTGPVGATRVLQVYRDAGGGSVLARALKRGLRGSGAVDLREREIRGSQQLTPAFWKSVLEGEQPSALVLWLDEADLSTLDSDQPSTGVVRQIYLSYSLLKETPPRPSKGLRGEVYLTYPYALPRPESPHVYRVRAWLRSRGGNAAHERTQLNTYFALHVTDSSLMRLAGSFSRDYLVETVEQETESALNPGVFPRLSLGPGQRFASKGSHIVKPSDDAQRGLESASGWIIP